jgi:hypothetical protein
LSEFLAQKVVCLADRYFLPDDKAHRVTLFCSGNQAFMFLNAQFF